MFKIVEECPVIEKNYPITEEENVRTLRFDNSIESTETEGNNSIVNHPSHYNREDAMECIDEMILIFGKETVMNFCLLNAWKYRYRAGDKNGETDLKKSDWYIKKYKELLEELQATQTS